MGLVARREDRLKAVADKALRLGSPDVIVILADVSVVEDCKRVVDETVNHFGQRTYVLYKCFSYIISINVFMNMT